MTRSPGTGLVRGACALLAIMAAGFMVWAAFWGDITVTRDQAQVQAIINQQLERLSLQPEEERKGALKNVRIKSVSVQITDSIAIDAEVEGARFAQNFEAAVHAVGVPDYRRNERAFFFRASDFKVTQFAYKGASVAEKTVSFVRRITRNEEANNLAAELAPKLEKWVTHLAEATVRQGLERFPVYRLKDDFKGHVISLALKSVEVRDGKIIAVVSVWQLTWQVLIFLVILVAAIGLFFAAPELAMLFAVFP